MRIGIDARLWNETGVGRYTRNLVVNLLEIDKENDYVLFVLRKDEASIKSQISSSKTQIVTADIRWHSVAEQKSFPKSIAKANIDLMHFPYFSVPIMYNMPFVVTIHDLILHHFSTGEASTLPMPVYRLKHALYKQVIKSAAKRARKIITVSEATKKEIVDHLSVPASKVIVTYEGVENPKFPASNFKIKEKYFLHVGNVYPHKNTNKLVSAFGELVKTYPDIYLVIVGKEDYFMKKLQSRAKELRSNIRFVGEVDDQKLQALYANAIALVTPSLMEGFGLPAVEAMASKCLVVASDIPSYKEVVGESGIYIDPNNISDIAQKLMSTYSMSHNEREKKIAEGLVRVKKYSWKIMAEQTLHVYEDCVGVRSG
jgi:glycosyltransferase involved in cell wall biosynthesis